MTSTSTDTGERDAAGTGTILLMVDQPLLREKLSRAAPLLGLDAMDGPAARQSVRVLVTGGMMPLDPALLDSLPNLGLIALPAAGYAGIDLDDARRRGLFVTNVGAVNHEDVADAAIGMMIALARGLVAGARRLRAGQWATGRTPPSHSLRARRVGIVGMGSIGQAIAERLQVFGCPIGWWGPTPKPDLRWPRAENLRSLAERSDILFVSAVATPQTRHLIDRAIIDRLGSDGLIVNVARGSLIDEDALIAALREGRIGGAALDVFETEPTPPERWPDSDRLLLTPHLAGVTHESLDVMFETVTGIVAGYLEGRMPADPLCAP